MALSQFHASIIDFERSWWKEPGSKEQAIRQRLTISPTRYYKVLAQLADSQEAYEYDPLVVRRFQLQRARRRATRIAGTSGGTRTSR
ncbi:MAG TPA: DUF3263 domain-containing protein [Acidimicrobiales bacterium]|nr:DUF3263 domain-containing protein [Acidimicrobiales bacterium]